MRVDDDPAGTHRVFEIHSSDDIDEIRATPRLVRWGERDRRIAQPGDVYRLGAGQFHATVVDVDQGAATVVLGQTRAVPDQSLGRIESSSHRVPRQLCSREETVQAAQIILDMMRAETTASWKARQ